MQWIVRDVHLGCNIARVRIDKGLTQDQLVAKMQIHGSSMSRSTLANIEAGNRNIKATDLKIIKELLGVSYQEFFAS